MYVCVCGILLLFLYPGNLTYITISTELCSSPTQTQSRVVDGGSRSLSSDSPICSRSEVLMEHSRHLGEMHNSLS